MKPIRKLTEDEKADKLLKTVKEFLEDPVWPPELEPMKAYIRVHDDHDGTRRGKVCVTLADDGDAWLEVEPNHHGGALRFRSQFGGGDSPRVRAALMLLMLAIKLDSEEKPQTQ